MDIRLFHLRRLEFVGRLLFDRVHSTFKLYQRRSLLRDRETVEISDHHDEKGGRRYAHQYLGIASRDRVRAHFSRLVYYRRTSTIPRQKSGRVYIRGEQTVRYNIVIDIILDTVYRYGVHLFGHFPRS